MKKKELIFDSTVNMTEDEWLTYRKSGIGASEVGVILGLSPYKSSISLFYDKIQPGLNKTIENMAMFMGTQLESVIASNMWPYWEGTEESVIQNKDLGKVIRRCERVRAYVRNPAFPHLFVSLDRKINKTETRGEGALEIKTIGGWEAEKWEAGIPPSHIMQVQTQVGVCRFLFGEIAILTGNRHFDVLPFDFMPETFQTIVDRTKDFWDKVVQARVWVTRKYEAEQSFNQRLAEECTAAIQSLEPAPDGSESYSQFMKEKYCIAVPGEQEGSLEQLGIARDHKKVKAEIKALDEKARIYEQQLKNGLRDNADKLLFGSDGYVSWKADTNNIRRFLNKAKEEK